MRPHELNQNNDLSYFRIMNRKIFVLKFMQNLWRTRAIFGSRLYSSVTHSRICHLKNRGMIHVHGKDSAKLLQGLITNDINHLERSTNILYSMFLNVQGRCVFDVFLYNSNGNEEGYLIESDVKKQDQLLTYLKAYKLRAKVKFQICNKQIFFLYKLDVSENNLRLESVNALYKDPRLMNLGYRLISEESIEKIQEIFNHELETDIHNYERYRYNIGLSEGSDETANCIPLEHNLALLNGVSFQKGCYIGQELVARINYVGIVRKRVMPITFSSSQHIIQKGNIIRNSGGKQVGKIIGVNQDKGIGLIRIRDCLKDSLSLYCTDDNSTKHDVQVHRPLWWPNDLEY